jgi:hypothetical protein
MLLLKGESKTAGKDIDKSPDELTKGPDDQDIVCTSLEKFMESYGEIRRSKPFQRDPDLWDLMQRLTTGLYGMSAVQSRPDIKIKWSVGQGNWVGVPHISFLDQKETTTTQRGVYGVFLFRDDLSGVYLTLNQGVTEFTKQYPRSEARRILRDRANRFGLLVIDLKNSGFAIDANIDLRTEGELGLDYEASTIAYKFYARDSVPSDGEISADLNSLLKGYDKLLLSKSPTRQSWIFQANPEQFDIDGALAALDELSWLVNQHQDDIHEGDEVFIWPSGAQGGVVATATVLSDPSQFESPPEEHSFNRAQEKFAGLRTRVRLRVDNVLNAPLLRTVIAGDSALSNLPILRMAQVTNSPVNADQSRALWRLIEQNQKDRALPTRKVWLIAAGHNAEHWEDFYRTGIIAIGWDGLGDLSRFKSRDEIAEALQALGWETDARNDSGSCYDFAHSMQEGDLVLVKKGRNSVVGYGVITGPYKHDPTRPSYRNIRSTRWQGRGDWKTDRTLALKTVTNITPQVELVDHLEQLVGVGKKTDEIEPLPPSERKPFSIEETLADLFLGKDDFEEIVRIWRSKKNLILQGPPGVGKTYIAQRLAYALMGFEDESRVRRIQFHQSYSYEDFIQGYRPAGNFFKRKDGIFYEFCRRAIRDDSNNYVFIIDEINRGNLSKIFGELMVLIEPDKRDPKWAVPLTYSEKSDEQFYIPGNVYLLGMMNTADRSLSMVDYALRRRFAFYNLNSQIENPVYIDYLTAHGVPDNIVKAIASRIGALNQFISNKSESNLGAGFCIGHSFFMPTDDSVALGQSWYRRIVDTEIIPLLSEYWFDDDERVDQWRGRLLAAI